MPRKSNLGFSLIEMTFALVAAAIIALSSIAAFIAVGRSGSAQTAISELDANVGILSDQLAQKAYTTGCRAFLFGTQTPIAPVPGGTITHPTGIGHLTNGTVIQSGNMSMRIRGTTISRPLGLALESRRFPSSLSVLQLSVRALPAGSSNEITSEFAVLARIDDARSPPEIVACAHPKSVLNTECLAFGGVDGVACRNRNPASLYSALFCVATGLGGCSNQGTLKGTYTNPISGL